MKTNWVKAITTISVNLLPTWPLLRQTAIWIVAEPREEHIKAISWLNEGEYNFYLLKIEGIRIGNSDPAPLITKIVGPSVESKELGKIKKEDVEKRKLRYEFWLRLLNYSKQKHNLFNAISPSHDAWIGKTSTISGVTYVYWLNMNSMRIELRIDRGKDSDQENLKIFNRLKEHKSKIEEKFQDTLHWDESEGNRMCAIRKQLTVGGYRNDDSEWDEIIENAVGAMVRLENATKNLIKRQ